MFDNAEFGKMYITRAGKRAVFIKTDILAGDRKWFLLIEGHTVSGTYTYDGKIYKNIKTDFDIVGEYKD